MKISKKSIASVAGSFVGAGLIAFMGAQAFAAEAPSSEPDNVPAIPATDGWDDANVQNAIALGTPLDDDTLAYLARGEADPANADSGAYSTTTAGNVSDEGAGGDAGEPAATDSPVATATGDEPTLGEPPVEDDGPMATMASDEINATAAAPPAPAVPPVADQPRVDPCWNEPDLPGCPDGVAAVVLGLEEDGSLTMPPLDLIAQANPPDWGHGWSNIHPVCRPVERQPGRVVMGASTNMPAGLRVLIASVGDDGTVASPIRGDDHEMTPDGPWQNWWEVSHEGADGPWPYFSTCFTIDDLPPGRYELTLTATSRYDYRVRTTRTVRVTVAAVVPDEDRVRRPVNIVGVGADELYVTATHTSDQSLWIAATTDPATQCENVPDAAFADPAAYGFMDSTVLSERELPASRLEDPTYKYLPEHSQEKTVRFNLTGGADMSLCVFWTHEGPIFDPVRIVEAEAYHIVPPQVKHPTVEVFAVAPARGDVASVTAHGWNEGCTDVTVEPTGSPRTLRVPTPLAFCDLQTDLTHVEIVGLRMELTTTLDDGTSETARARIPMDILCLRTFCDADTAEPEYSLALPAIDGSSTGRIYLRVKGDGERITNSKWTVSDPAPFTDQPPVYADDLTQFDWTTTVERKADWSADIAVHVEFTEPVSGWLRLHQLDPPTEGSPPVCHTSDQPNEFYVDAVDVINFVFEDVCQGRAYAPDFEGYQVDELDIENPDDRHLVRAWEWHGATYVPGPEYRTDLEFVWHGTGADTNAMLMDEMPGDKVIIMPRKAEFVQTFGPTESQLNVFDNPTGFEDSDVPAHSAGGGPANDTGICVGTDPVEVSSTADGYLPLTFANADVTVRLTLAAYPANENCEVVTPHLGRQVVLTAVVPLDELTTRPGITMAPEDGGFEWSFWPRLAPTE